MTKTSVQTTPICRSPERLDDAERLLAEKYAVEYQAQIRARLPT